MDVVRVFQIASVTVFCLILTKVGTHDLSANTKKNSGTDFLNFALKNFGENVKNFVSAV